MLRHSISFVSVISLWSLAAPLSAQVVHQAVQAGDLEQVVALLDSDPGALESLNEEGRTPMHIAAAAGHLGIANYLADRGGGLGAVDSQGSTPLGLALLSGNQEMIEGLLELGSDPDGGGGRGLSAIDLAFALDCQRDSKLTPILISWGGRLVPEAPWAYSISRLDLTATFGSAGMARLLLDLGADPNLPGRGGETALVAAARAGHDELVQVLLESGADPEVIDARGNTPLSWAVERGHREVVGLLLEHGAGVDFVRPEAGQTLLHLASQGGHLDVVGALVEKGLSLNALDTQGHSALYYASKYGHAGIVDLLVASGAERSQSETEVERFGRSPYLDGGIEEGEAALWYLSNRGWVVKTSDHLLVFDQEEFGVTRPTEPSLANGFLTPWEIGDQDVVAMYTCYHGEVGEPAYIHEIEDSLKSVVYIQNAGDRWQGSERSVYLSPREKAPLDGGEVTVIGTMTQMATLGHLVEIDGLNVYYQGFSPDDMEYYLDELGYLGTVADRIDLAFLPIPDLDGEVEGSGFRAFVDRFQPSAIALLDPGRREDVYPRVAELVRSWGYRSEIFAAEHPGDIFVFRRR